jgi:hypothetical protein
LNRSALQPVALDARDRDEFVLSRVRVANTQAFIPDLDAIESKLAQVIGVPESPPQDWQG